MVTGSGNAAHCKANFEGLIVARVTPWTPIVAAAHGVARSVKITRALSHQCRVLEGDLSDGSGGTLRTDSINPSRGFGGAVLHTLADSREHCGQ